MHDVMDSSNLDVPPLKTVYDFVPALRADGKKPNVPLILKAAMDFQVPGLIFSCYFLLPSAPMICGV